MFHYLSHASSTSLASRHSDSTVDESGISRAGLEDHSTSAGGGAAVEPPQPEELQNRETDNKWLKGAHLQNAKVRPAFVTTGPWNDVMTLFLKLLLIWPVRAIPYLSIYFWLRLLTRRTLRLAAQLRRIGMTKMRNGAGVGFGAAPEQEQLAKRIKQYYHSTEIAGMQIWLGFLDKVCFLSSVPSGGTGSSSRVPPRATDSNQRHDVARRLINALKEVLMKVLRISPVTIRADFLFLGTSSSTTSSAPASSTLLVQSSPSYLSRWLAYALKIYTLVEVVFFLWQKYRIYRLNIAPVKPPRIPSHVICSNQKRALDAITNLLRSSSKLSASSSTSTRGTAGGGGASLQPHEPFARVNLRHQEEGSSSGAVSLGGSKEVTFNVDVLDLEEKMQTARPNDSSQESVACSSASRRDERLYKVRSVENFFRRDESVQEQMQDLLQLAPCPPSSGCSASCGGAAADEADAAASGSAKSLKHVQDLREAFVCGWFRYVDKGRSEVLVRFEDLKRRNVEDWCCMTFMNDSASHVRRENRRSQHFQRTVVTSVARSHVTRTCSTSASAASERRHHLDQLVRQLETFVGREFAPGRNSGIRCMRPMLDPLKADPFPAAYYFITEKILPLITHLFLRRYQFRELKTGSLSYYVRKPAAVAKGRGGPSSTRSASASSSRGGTRKNCGSSSAEKMKNENTLSSSFSSSICDEEQAPAEEEEENCPFVFIHGLGFGIFEYLTAIEELVVNFPRRDIFIPVIPHISMQLRESVQSASEMVACLTDMLAAHYDEYYFLTGVDGAVGSLEVLRSLERESEDPNTSGSSSAEGPHPNEDTEAVRMDEESISLTARSNYSYTSPLNVARSTRRRVIGVRTTTPAAGGGGRLEGGPDEEARSQIPSASEENSTINEAADSRSRQNDDSGIRSGTIGGSSPEGSHQTRPRRPGAHFIGHSYGSFILSWVLKRQPRLVKYLSFLDPICFLMQMPDVVYNAGYRTPPHYAALLLRTFIMREPHIANTLARALWPNEVHLYVEDIGEHIPTFVALCGLDGLIPAHSVKLYLELKEHRAAKAGGGGPSGIREPRDVDGGTNIDIAWFPNLGHAEWVGFADPFTTRKIAGPARQEIFRRIRALERSRRSGRGRRVDDHSALRLGQPIRDLVLHT